MFDVKVTRNFLYATFDKRNFVYDECMKNL